LTGSTGGNSRATAINNRGQVIVLTAGHAVVWDRGQTTDLGRLASATAINDRGQVVGLRGGQVAVWDRGQTTDLGTAAAARGINARGQIVGWATSPGYCLHAVLWQPEN
jgi:probable HAF family extracellular repeat protein